MKIELAFIGKTSQDFVEDGLQMYSRRLEHYTDFSVKEIKMPKPSSKLSPAHIKEKEAEKFSDYASEPNTILVLLDENGKKLKSLKFASFLLKRMQTGKQKIVFAVGGAYGFSDQLKKQSDFLLSLSDMTFSHQIVRVIFAEQLYRAFTIIHKEPYHNQ